jgi:hypothetical protein
VTFIISRTKRHIQNLTSFHGWLDPTIIYRDPVEITTKLYLCIYQVPIIINIFHEKKLNTDSAKEQ